MTLRARRLVGALVVLVALLFVGRWTVAFVAERWWAATLAPAAASFVTDWQLLGLALDVGAILIASIWFAIHALIVARAIASVQVTHRFGDLQLREAVPTQLLLGGAAASGILLGLIAGAGAHAWREPIVLAWRGVTYGVTDPLLNLDLGVFVAQVPAWDLGHRFVVLLALLGFAFCIALYSGIGALKRDRNSLIIHADARHHLGALLAFIAVTIAIGYLLVPYHLAALSMPSLTPSGALARIRASQILVGISLATAVLTLLWTWRGNNTLLVAGWIVLLLGALGERFAVPALIQDAAPASSRLAMMRRFDGMAWGIRESVPFASTDTTPRVTALWDEDLLGRVVERGGGTMAAASAAVIAGDDGRSVPVWLVASQPAADSDRLEVLAIADGVTGSGGSAAVLRSPEESRATRPIWRNLAAPHSWPYAPSWRFVNDGVSAPGVLRRVLLAWARQAPGMLRDGPQPDLDWHLDPVERANAVLPMLSWLPADLAMVRGRATWVVQGMVTVEHFPLSTRTNWDGHRVAGAVPAVLASVDAASGETHFYTDPAADSLGAAWAHLAGKLIAPASAIPSDLRAGIPYANAWFQAQASVLEAPVWNAGRRPQQLTQSAPTPTWVAVGIPVAGRQVILEEPGHGSVATIVTAFRIGGIPQLRVERREADAAVSANRAELRQLWNRSPSLQHLRDSVTAAGDSVVFRSPRWYAGTETTAAWQPLFAVPRHGPPSVLWISTAVGERTGGGRTSMEAWGSTAEKTGSGDQHADDETAILSLARQWVQSADSALRRGDLTAFGRAFEALRSVLQKAPR